MDLSDERKWKRRKEKASASKNLPNLYTACKELGEFYHREERFEEALKEYQAAEKVARTIKNKIDIGVANRMIGEVLCCMGEFDQAIRHQKKHLELSKEEKNLVEEQRALATLGRTYFVKAESYADVDSDERRRALNYSQKYYKESLSVCDKLGNSVGQAQLLIMKARLFINLGLTLESEQSQQNSSEAIKLYEKAISICRKNEFWDELCRGYTVLGTAHFHQKDSAASLRAFDNALKITMKSDNKAQQSSELLLAKAEVLVDINDLVGAKQVLLKAYKLKNPCAKDREEIARRARIVVAMCDAEDKLISTSVDDFKTRKELHEKIADGFVALTNYSKAIDHYLKMLQCAESLGQQGKELIPCYVSLSQTYKDNQQYDLAYEYFEKELNVNSDNPVEACKTLINMAVVLELQHKSVEEVLSVYRQAHDEAKKANNLKLEASVLKAMISLHNEQGYDGYDEIKKELERVRQRMADENIDEDEEEGSQEETVEDVEIGADVCLSDVTDSEEEEEFDRAARPVRKRSARSSNLMKRNEKGETPLHVACEKGSLALVKNLIKQGHPLDVQDAAGWLPLHEACNHGHVKVVEELINAGANINDRGGPGCEGITPLHDAASSGHLDVVELLLDRGASPLVKTNKGETVLDCLLECRRRVVAESGKELDPISLAHFESVAERLKACLERVGESTTNLPKTSKSVDDVSRRRRDSAGPSRPKDNGLRSMIETIEDDETAAFEYQKTIRAMRRPPPRQTEEPVEPEKTEAPAFLHTEEVGNDWLEDDLLDVLPPPKKRSNDYIGQTYRQSSSSNRNKRSMNIDSRRSVDYGHPTKRKRSVSSCSSDSLTNGDTVERSGSPFPPLMPLANSSIRYEEQGPFVIEDNSPDFDEMSTPGSPELITRPANNTLRQKTLTQLDFPALMGNISDRMNGSSVLGGLEYDNRSHSPERSSGVISGPRVEEPEEPEPALEPERELSPEPIQSAKQFVKVRIEDELIEISVPQDIGPEERDATLTASWLAKELRSIFISEDGRAPTLILKTPEGVVLSGKDSVSSFIANVEIVGEVSLWSQVTLLEQYKEICQLKNLSTNPSIAEVLKSCQTTSILKIKNSLVANQRTLDALFTVVVRQHLKCVILNIPLDQNLFEILAECLSISEELSVLNLLNTGIAFEEMSLLSEIPDNVWQNLRYLNLSHNPLGDESFVHLSNIVKAAPDLRYLNLENCDLTQKCVEEVPELLLENLEELNVSYNELQAEGLLAFLRCLDPTRLKSICLAATGSSKILRELALFLDGQCVENLRTVDLSMLNLTDSDIEIFCNSVKSASNLKYLNLLDNPKLTQKSFFLLGKSFQHLETILFSGADFGYIDPEVFRKFLHCTFSSSLSLEYPAYMKGIDGFIYSGRKSKTEAVDNDGTKDLALISSPNLSTNISRVEEAGFERQIITNATSDKLPEEFKEGGANNFNDSFNFDLNDSFENQFLANDSKNVVAEGDNDETQFMADDSNPGMEGAVESDKIKSPIKWNDDIEASEMNNSGNNALFEDSD